MKKKVTIILFILTMMVTVLSGCRENTRNGDPEGIGVGEYGGICPQCGSHMAKGYTICPLCQLKNQ